MSQPVASVINDAALPASVDVAVAKGGRPWRLDGSPTIGMSGRMKGSLQGPLLRARAGGPGPLVG